ncbi:MAG: IS66 family insertion sequence element accessory protein TnpB [Spirochaetes bacterium]|nr:IS66 family insertion sequence element accessory protein TnpB [Spirochaetota bacterium]
MRKAINGLLAMIDAEMKLNALENAAFLFCGLTKRNLKVIFWDKNGFCLLQKKLEAHKYAWPKSEAQAQEITHADLDLLLQGLDISARHTVFTFPSLS